MQINLISLWYDILFRVDKDWPNDKLQHIPGAINKSDNLSPTEYQLVLFSSLARLISGTTERVFPLELVSYDNPFLINRVLLTLGPPQLVVRHDRLAD